MGSRKEAFKTRENVFDRFTIANIMKICHQLGIPEDKLMPISIGKEANLFKASSPERDYAIKIYRLETCDFNRMQDYLKGDYRFKSLKNKRQVIFAWAKREFINLRAASSSGIACPLPYLSKFNIIVMQFIGKEWPSPKLKDALLKSKKAKLEMLQKTCRQVNMLKKINLVHGDLSEYNILVKEQEPCLIDFSHSSPADSALGRELCQRDRENIMRFFKGIGLEEDKIQKEISKA
ncbi:MAG TPA: serine protein kinase RIO [Candidatus Woesearchaeota archaeon]|nr:serine protein kinase RIO [Candidatus Woesearchaeota archaeon]